MRWITAAVVAASWIGCVAGTSGQDAAVDVSADLSADVTEETSPVDIAEDAPSELPPPAERVRTGLVLLHTFDQFSGSEAPDLSGVEPLAPLLLNGPPKDLGWLAGRPGIAISNDVGGGRFFATGEEGGLDKVWDLLSDSSSGSNALTLEVWCKASTTGPMRSIINIGSFGDQRFVSLDAHYGDLGARVRTTSGEVDNAGQLIGGEPVVKAVDAVDNTDEHHYVVTYSESTGVTLYVDGAAAGTHPLMGKFDEAWTGYPDYSVGRVATDADTQWTGEVYLTALYRRVLDASEVAQNFAAGTPVRAE